MEGYYVDNAVAWNSKQSIDFVNEALGIRKPLVRGLRLMDYPGWDSGSWERQVERDWYKRGGCLRCDVSPHDELGRSKVLITIQWHDTPDETGFGMEDIAEIVLYSTLDERGNYLHPFRLYSLGY